MAKHKMVCTRGWSSARDMYVCADSTHIKISRKSFKYCEPDEDYSSDSTEPEIVEKYIAPKSGIVYGCWRDIL